MAGLIEKDMRLLLRRKNILALLLALAVVLGLTQKGTFIIWYLPFLGMILTTSTITYDEIDNGYSYLMALPIDAKTYVKEKYLFCISGTFISWILAVVLYFISQQIRGEKVAIIDNIPVVACFLPAVVLLTVIMIPIKLKFGVEKSRIVLFVIFGIIAAVSFLFVKANGTETMNQIILKINNMNETSIVLGGILFVILATVLSYLISCKIMQNKEL